MVWYVCIKINDILIIMIDTPIDVGFSILYGSFVPLEMLYWFDEIVSFFDYTFLSILGEAP